MKITIKENVQTKEETKINDVKLGYVFEILDNGSSNHVRALKLFDDEVVLLQYSSGHDWFELRDDESWKNSPVRILGKLIEIVVDPNM